MPDPTQDRYAELAWSPADVQTLRPYWSIERCRRELEANEKHIRDRLCELGWDVIGALISGELVFVIQSQSEDGFWNNESGWGAFGSATIFDDEEQKTFNLPLSAGNDARWVKLQDAEAEFGLHPENPEYDGNDGERTVVGIRCNNCNKQWSSDEELPQVKLQDGEIVKGCDQCGTDEFLMDLFEVPQEDDADVPDPSDRREEATFHVLCQKLLEAGFVTLSNTHGPTEILEPNVGALTAGLTDKGGDNHGFLLFEPAFSFSDRQHAVQSVSMGELLEVQPMGADGFLLSTGNELWVHPRAIMAEFQPQAEINNGKSIINIDGRRKVDVTRAVLACSLDYIQKMRDDQIETDQLVDTEALGHSGPFYVAVEDAIRHFFGVEELADITQAMLDEARRNLPPPALVIDP